MRRSRSRHRGPLRIVLERDGTAAKLTFQALTSLDGYAREAFTALFEGTTRDDFSVAHFEQL